MRCGSNVPPPRFARPPPCAGGCFAVKGKRLRVYQGAEAWAAAVSFCLRRIMPPAQGGRVSIASSQHEVRRERCVPGGRSPGSGAAPRHRNFAKQSILCYTLHSKEWGRRGAAGYYAACCVDTKGWISLCCVKYERGAGYELRHCAGAEV